MKRRSFFALLSGVIASILGSNAEASGTSQMLTLQVRFKRGRHGSLIATTEYIDAATGHKIYSGCGHYVSDGDTLVLHNAVPFNITISTSGEKLL